MSKTTDIRLDSLPNTRGVSETSFEYDERTLLTGAVNVHREGADLDRSIRKYWRNRFRTGRMACTRRGHHQADCHRRAPHVPDGSAPTTDVHGANPPAHASALVLVDLAASRVLLPGRAFASHRDVPLEFLGDPRAEGRAGPCRTWCAGRRVFERLA